MERVTLYLNEEEYQLYHDYCTNYYRHYDETRKNSIKILLELYKQQVIDIQEVFSFFYQKKQEFEIKYQIPGIDANGQMRLRICLDIIAFLEDLQKIYRLLRKKGMDANYYFIIGVFSKIADEEFRLRCEVLHKTSSYEINAIVSPLGKAIEKKLGPEVDTPILLGELVSFIEIFNRLSPDVTFNDDITSLIAISLLRMFGKEETDEEILALLKSYRDQFETDELESVLEESPRTQGAWDLDFSWVELLKPLRTLNERIAQIQIPMRRSLEVLAALDAPVKTVPAHADYSSLILYQNPAGLVRRRNEENRILVQEDNRPRSEVHLAPATDYISVEPSQEYPYKQYFSLTTGVMILVILVLASVVFSFFSASVFVTDTGNSTGVLARINKTEFSAANLYLTPTTTITPVPSPKPTPQYVTIEPVIADPVTGPESHRTEYQKLALVKNFLFNPSDYITIYKNNMTYNLVNAYKISFDLKNPPMIIRYNVVPHNLTNVIWFEPRDAKKKINTTTINRPDESAWFEAKISRDNVLYDQEGWGGIYGNPLSVQEIVIRDVGKYQIEFSGRLTTVSTEVLVKKEGNIVT